MDVKLTVLITEELRRKAKATAALQGVTMSEIVRQALEQFVEDFDPEQLRGTAGVGAAAEGDES